MLCVTTDNSDTIPKHSNQHWKVAECWLKDFLNVKYT